MERAETRTRSSWEVGWGLKMVSYRVVGRERRLGRSSDGAFMVFVVVPPSGNKAG